MRIAIQMEEWDNALSAMHGPGAETVAELQGIMSTAFADTQAVVPVQTGSLKGSGRLNFELESAQWSGEITYGGSAPGFVHDPVLYAGEQDSRKDFLAVTDQIHGALAEAMFASMKSRMKE